MKINDRCVGILLASVLLLAQGGCAKKEASSEESSQSAKVEKITLSAVNDMMVEYGSDASADAVDLLKKSLAGNEDEESSDVVVMDGKQVNISADPSTVDTTVLGDTEVNYSFSYDQNGSTQTDEKKVKITVQDTKPPVIHASHSYEVRVGQTFYPDKVIASVADPVDGELVQVASEPAALENQENGVVYSHGWYTVDYSVNTRRTGVYSMHIHAVDRHGLVSDDSQITITVNARSWHDARYTATPEPTEEPEETIEPTVSPEPISTPQPEEPTPEPTEVPSPTPEPENPEPLPEENQAE